MFTLTHTTLAATLTTLTTLIALLTLARTAAYPTPPPPSLHALGLRGAAADVVGARAGRTRFDDRR